MTLLSQIQAESLPQVNSMCTVLLCKNYMEVRGNAVSLNMGSFPSVVNDTKLFYWL